MGPVPCARAYYYCGRCGHGLFPWDQAVGLTPRSFTPATERLVCLAGTLSDGFEEAATKVLPEMAGLTVAETTVQRTTEAAGERLGKKLEQGAVFGSPRPWDWNRDRHGKRCAYVSVDWTGILMQGAKGAKADMCPICDFQTTPPHDGRTHRYQKKKAPLSAAELTEKGLAKM
jgi:hypothetical protein